MHNVWMVLTVLAIFFAALGFSVVVAVDYVLHYGREWQHDYAPEQLSRLRADRRWAAVWGIIALLAACVFVVNP